MPTATSVGEAKRKLLYSHASPSSLLWCSKDSGEYIDFGSGFVLYDNSSKTVILTSACFDDGTVKQASVFVSDARSVYTSLVVDSIASSKPVVFSESAVTRGDFVFTVARVLPEIRRPGMYTGSTIHPGCLSVDIHSGRPVKKYGNFFALSCPVAGPCQGLKKTWHYGEVDWVSSFQLGGGVCGCN